MNQKLQRKLNQLDTDLAELLKRLQKFSDADLNWSPKNGEWSVLQVMTHLMLAEKYGHQYMEKKLSYNPTLKKAGILAGFRKQLMEISLKLPIKFKAPVAISGEQLPKEAAFWEVVKEWTQQRENLKSFLEKLPPEIHKSELYKHPLAGRLTTSGMLTFFDLHFKRHRKQIERILVNYRY